ncbi:AAA family ATPase [Granulosicoccus sp.]|nr:AAA family ATPase [Granulosicoccus sp.]
MLYVISGCSCGGKNTLIKALNACGYSIADKPGREIVRAELDRGGDALPWNHPVKFSIKCGELSVQRYEVKKNLVETVFFDRSLVDAVSALNEES